MSQKAQQDITKLIQKFDNLQETIEKLEQESKDVSKYLSLLKEHEELLTLLRELSLQRGTFRTKSKTFVRSIRSVTDYEKYAAENPEIVDDTLKMNHMSVDYKSAVQSLLRDDRIKESELIPYTVEKPYVQVRTSNPEEGDLELSV